MTCILNEFAIVILRARLLFLLMDADVVTVDIARASNRLLAARGRRPAWLTAWIDARRLERCRRS